MHPTTAYLEPVFRNFTQLLHQRQLRGSLNKEDAVRYSFFHALVTTGGIDQADIFLETPHLGLEGFKEIDLMVPPQESREGLLLEFKYDTRPPGGRNINSTDRGAALLRDLYRLSTYEPEKHWRRLMVYVSDNAMANYFRKPGNGLTTFFDSQEESDIANLVLANTGRTYTKAFKGIVPSTRSRVLFRADQEGAETLCIRMFETSPAVTP